MTSMALAFDILARDRGASKTFDKVGDSADRAGRKGKGFGNAIKVGLGVASGALAALGLSSAIGSISGLLSDSIAEGREAQKVGRTTAQIIKATGGAAKISADQVGALAERISEKAGVDDEAIQTGANLLLTFKKVRNEAGKGGAVFDRATQAAVDLSATGFGSIDSSSKMLGKALNDPLRGITALSRAGVTFTDQQKEQIKTLVKSGDVLSAQKVILGEVESQVGGVAAASASTADKVKVSWDNLKERIGTALLPTLDKLGDWFLNKGLPAIQKFGEWVKDKLWPALKDGWESVRPGLEKAQKIIMDAFGGDSSQSVKDFSTFLTEKLIPGIAEFVNVWLPIAARQFAVTVEAVKGLWSVMKTLLTIQGQFAAAILQGFSSITNAAATMLEALSNVPGFGWAKDAAAKLRNAAGGADRLRDAINDIPTNKNVTVDVSYRATQSGRFDPAPTGYGPGRAKGGPVRKGTAYPVGENPDGSWNKTTELFVPAQSGQVVTQKQLAAAMLGPGSGGETNDNRLVIQGDLVLPSANAREMRRDLERERRYKSTRSAS